MKTEPEEFSIADLKRIKIEPWTGVRNFQARNYMKNEMQLDDSILIYHSSCEVPGVYGLGKVSHLAEPDQAQFDKKSKYFDPKSKKENPRWYGVRVRYVETFKVPVTLKTMKNDPDLQTMLMFRNGRLSVTPVSSKEFKHILSLSK